MALIKTPRPTHFAQKNWSKLHLIYIHIYARLICQLHTYSPLCAWFTNTERKGVCSILMTAALLSGPSLALWDAQPVAEPNLFVMQPCNKRSVLLLGHWHSWWIHFYNDWGPPDKALCSKSADCSGTKTYLGLRHNQLSIDMSWMMCVQGFYFLSLQTAFIQ